MTADAREAGRFELYIDKKTGRLASMDWEVIPVTDKIADAPEFTAVTDKYKDLLTKLAVRVGATSVMLDATSLSSRTKETNVGNFVADSYRRPLGCGRRAGKRRFDPRRPDLQPRPAYQTRRALDHAVQQCRS